MKLKGTLSDHFLPSPRNYSIEKLSEKQSETFHGNNRKTGCFCRIFFTSFWFHQTAEAMVL